MTTKENEKARQTQVSYAQNQCNSELVSGGLGSFREESQILGTNANELDSQNSERERERLSRGSVFGGILSQLREIRESHLAYVRAHRMRLETRLKENLEHEQKILQRMDDLEAEIEQLLKKSFDQQSKFE